MADPDAVESLRESVELDLEHPRAEPTSLDPAITTTRRRRHEDDQDDEHPGTLDTRRPVTVPSPADRAGLHGHCVLNASSRSSSGWLRPGRRRGEGCCGSWHLVSFASRLSLRARRVRRGATLAHGPEALVPRQLLATAAAPVIRFASGPTAAISSISRGRPFLIVGDSPQALVVERLAPRRDRFLADRAANGFNTVWVNLLCTTYTGGRPDGATYDQIAPFTTAR